LAGGSTSPVRWHIRSWSGTPPDTSVLYLRSGEERRLNAIANKVPDVIFGFASVGWQSFRPANGTVA
jgi:hypothetical protein